MSGHSKWSTIKRKKGANDAKRGKLFAKLIRAIEVAGKTGGADPNNNASLYQAISKAKSNSVPNSNIENALKRINGDCFTPIAALAIIKNDSILLKARLFSRDYKRFADDTRLGPIKTAKSL